MGFPLMPCPGRSMALTRQLLINQTFKLSQSGLELGEGRAEPCPSRGVFLTIYYTKNDASGTSITEESPSLMTLQDRSHHGQDVVAEELCRCHLACIVGIFEVLRAEFVDLFLGDQRHARAGASRRRGSRWHAGYGWHKSRSCRTCPGRGIRPWSSGSPCSCSVPLPAGRTGRQRGMGLVVMHELLDLGKPCGEDLASGHHPLAADEVHGLDVVGAFPDGIDPAVAELLGNGVLFGEAVAAVALHGFGDAKGMPCPSTRL